MRGRRTIRTSKTRRAVLTALAEGWSVHAAAQRAGIGYSSLFEWRQADRQFAAEVDAAIEAATDLLEDEARRRAMDQSDLLLIFLLRSRRPYLYARKMVETAAGIAAPPVTIVSNRPRIYLPANFRDRPEPPESPMIEGEEAA